VAHLKDYYSTKLISARTVVVNAGQLIFAEDGSRAAAEVPTSRTALPFPLLIS
jgi:hypothetical protein